jgi:MFS family permease
LRLPVRLAAPASPLGWLVLIAGLAVFFAADDQTSVVALLPSMISDLEISQDEFYRAAWIINGYILGYVVVMPLMARASDVVGLGRGLAVALGVFCAGSAAVALSSDLTTVTAFRGVQAIGAGALLPISMAMVTGFVAPGQRAMGLGAIAAASEIGAFLGPLWGGVIASITGWQGVFWINLPMCLPLALAAWRLSPGVATGAIERLDLLGAALFAAALACLAVALTDDPIAPRPVAVTAALLVAAAGLLLFFVRQEASAKTPMVDLQRLRSVPIATSLFAGGLLGAALIVALVNVPLFTNTVLRGNALEGGLNLMRLSIGLAAGAFLGGILTRRYGPQLVAGSGAVLAAAGFLGMASWDEEPGVLLLSGPLLVCGLGFGLTLAPLASVVMDHVAEAERATWAALLNVVRLLGALVGVALLTSRGLGSFYVDAGQVPLDDPDYARVIETLQVSTYQETFIAAAAVCLLALLPLAIMARDAARRAEFPSRP